MKTGSVVNFELVFQIGFDLFLTLIFYVHVGIL